MKTYYHIKSDSKYLKHTRINWKVQQTFSEFYKTREEAAGGQEGLEAGFKLYRTDRLDGLRQLRQTDREDRRDRNEKKTSSRTDSQSVKQTGV